MVILMLVRRIKMFIGPVQATHKNSGNKHQYSVKLNNTGLSNRD